MVRTINPDNRREYILALTKEGHDAVKELMMLVDQWQNEALSVLSEADQHHFLTMVQTIRDHCDTMK